jgi:D-alanyl-lipoteichoic acid acyltransferase DltB (MBOAT superfamily)
VNFTSPLFFIAPRSRSGGVLSPPRPVAGDLSAGAVLRVLCPFEPNLSFAAHRLLLIVASATVYAIGLAIAKSGSERRKHAYMAAGVAAVVAVIVVFKAAGAWRGLLLPLGVSYYSFKLISYLIDVYWDEEAVERDPAVFFLFPAFFPQILSGPIQRPEPFFAQMGDVMARSLDSEQIETGFRYILGGLMMPTR